jgi:hypothetical protein
VNAGLFDRTSRAAEETLGLAPVPS